MINPMGVAGQIEGGTAMGLGLAVMEEVRLDEGRIANASFTDYLIPTILDAPPVRFEVVEDPEPDVPYGVKGIGESATIVATAAVVAAIRDATGLELNRAPVTTDDLVGLRPPAGGGPWAPNPGGPWQTPVPEVAGLRVGQQTADDRSERREVRTVDRKALTGRDYIETLDWTTEEIDEAIAVAGDLKTKFKARRAAPPAARQDAVHAVPGQVDPHAQRVRGRHDPARRARALPGRRQDAGRPRREPEGHGHHPVAVRPRPGHPPRPGALRGERVHARGRAMGRHPGHQPAVRHRPPDADARRPHDAPRAAGRGPPRAAGRGLVGVRAFVREAAVGRRRG